MKKAIFIYSILSLLFSASQSGAKSVTELIQENPDQCFIQNNNLDLSNQSLTSIDGIQKLLTNNITEIDLSNNQLTTLKLDTDILLHAPNLKILNLKKNQLSGSLITKPCIQEPIHIDLSQNYTLSKKDADQLVKMVKLPYKQRIKNFVPLSIFVGTAYTPLLASIAAAIYLENRLQPDARRFALLIGVIGAGIVAEPIWVVGLPLFLYLSNSTIAKKINEFTEKIEKLYNTHTFNIPANQLRT